MTKVIGLHTLHDANLSVCIDGVVKVVLELERLFDVRYFCSAPQKNKFTEQWKRALNVVNDYLGIEEFDIAVTSWVLPSQVEVLKSLIKASKWVIADHHHCHALSVLYDAPSSMLDHSLILTYDGGGNDGTFRLWSAEGFQLKPLQNMQLNLGAAYRQIAVCMPELTHEERDLDNVGTYMRWTPLNLAGKMMGYSALGSIQDHWKPHLQHYYRHFVSPLASVFTLGEKIGLVLEANSLKEDDAQNLAATSQCVFTDIVLEEIANCLRSMSPLPTSILLSGGCALNVTANQAIFERFGLPVYVGPAPNDCGISVGAAWSVQPPESTSRLSPYLGLPCWDGCKLKSLAASHGGTEVTVNQVAKLLTSGKVIGVVRGRQEFGPRALGHRSILAFPNDSELVQRLNSIKGREWFRPVCPAILLEHVAQLFESASIVNGSGCLESPYMSFSPRLKPEAKSLYPAICHFDQTARLQTVTRETDDWFHELLGQVASEGTGHGILINTSFNAKGKPILNRMETALDLLHQTSLDFVLIENLLFSAS